MEALNRRKSLGEASHNTREMEETNVSTQNHKRRKISNPDGGKYIVRLLLGYGYDVRIVFDTGEEFTEKHVSILPTKCKNEFHFAFKPVYDPLFDDKRIESYSAVSLTETDMDQVVEEYTNVKELFHELNKRKEGLFCE